MFRRTSPRRDARPTRRRGAILLVVLTMLALFAVIGLSFVLYAESEATAARISKAAVNTDLGLPETSGAVNGFLEQMLFQPDKRESALWGNELSRLMYGNAQAQPGNTTPYNGVGVYSETLTFTASGMPNLHRSQVVRFGKHPTNNAFVFPDQTYADPAYDYSTPPGAGLNLKYVGRNAPYTYADRNNIYVAVQDPATGRIVKPSYHAPSLFGPLDPSNLNWYTPQGYFQVLRPRTIDHLTGTPGDPTTEIGYIKSTVGWPIPTVLSAAQITQLGTILSGNDSAAPISFKRAFPFVAANPDGSFTGDVQNVRGTENQQAFDSVWLDLKLPVITYRGTRRLQPMIAATVLPLDGRINYNVASVTGSNQGFGPSEINLSKVLPAATAAEMVKQRFGTATVAPVPSGSTNLYDYFHADPSAPALATSATYPPSYSAVDFTGVGGAQPAAPTNFATSYTYLNTTYNSGNGSAAYKQPPLYFNPFQWNPLTTTGRADGSLTPLRGNQFPLADTRYLEARYSTKVKTAQDFTNLGNYDAPGAPAPTPLNFSRSSPGHPMNRARALLTPMSNRRSVPGLAPMAIGNITGVASNAGAPALVLNPGATAPILADTAALGTPLAGPAFNLATMGTTYPLTSTAVGGDITGSPTAQAANLRAILQGVDLNRPLADYRDPTTQPKTVAGGNVVNTNADWPFIPGTVPSAVAPIVTVTPASSARASADRQALATDIFARLCVALNARVYYPSPTPTPTGLVLPQSTGTAGAYTLTVGAQIWNVSQAEYDAVRWVAQLSANIVDAIDPDDVSTVFQWNSPSAAVAAGGTTAFTPDAAGGLNDCVVFGVEKPKLLVNEVYAEVANKEADYAKNEITAGDKFTIRFFVELLNPNNAEVSNTPMPAPAMPVVPAVDQSARNGGRASLQFPTSGGVTAYSCYRVRVYDKGITAVGEAVTTSNFNYVLGQPATTTAAKLEANFLGIKCSADPMVDPGLTFFVEPNNGAFRSEASASMGPPVITRGRKGFCVVGPELDPAKTETPATAFAPKTNLPAEAANFLLMKTTPAAATLDQFEYDCPIAPPADPADIKVQVVDELNKQESHTVLLQRLANPYQPENATAYNPANGPYNPYITVDMTGGVKINDAIRIGQKKGTDGKRPTPAKPEENFALGRVQPYAGYQMLTDPMPPMGPYFQTDPTTPPIGQTLAVLQNPQPAPPVTEPRNTFFRHNSQANPALAGDPTLILPFTEPFQPDRRLINPLEVLHLSMAPSHLLTRNFARPDATYTAMMPKPPFFYQQELSRVAFTPPATVMPAPPAVSPLLYRALEALSVKPWTYGVPHAGRTPGGVNVNMIWDQLNKAAGNAASGESMVFQALLDPQPANTFWAANPNESAATNAIWQRLRGSRNPNWDTAIDAPRAAATPPALGATVDEWDPFATPPGFGKDRPFKGFGVGQYDTNSGGMASPQGLESTLLRSDPTTGVPLFFNTAGQTDPYRQAEPLRKAFNNLTTVSDNYLVVFTVGFFDIDLPSYQQSPSRVVLRREAYEQVPGDLRAQFTAVIDRSGLAVDANNPGATGKFAQTAAADFVRVADGTVGMKKYANYAISFPADASSTPAAIKVRDMPTVPNSMFTLAPGSPLRMGDGPNANTYNVLGAPTAPVYNTGTGIATVFVDSGVLVDASGTPISPGLDAMMNPIPPGRLPNHAAGELICLPDNEANGSASPNDRVFIPGNPGRVQGFSPTDPRFRGVVRYFGRMQP